MYFSNCLNIYAQCWCYPIIIITVKKQKKLKYFNFTFVSWWSGATPERTSPNGVGNLSMISTCASWCAFSIYSHTQQFKRRKIIKKLVINYAFLYFLRNQTYNYIHTYKHIFLWGRERERERERDLPFQRCRSQRVHFQRHKRAMDGKRELKNFWKARSLLERSPFSLRIWALFYAGVEFRFSIPNVVYIYIYIYKEIE